MKMLTYVSTGTFQEYYSILFNCNVYVHTYTLKKYPFTIIDFNFFALLSNISIVTSFVNKIDMRRNIILYIKNLFYMCIDTHNYKILGVRV